MLTYRRQIKERLWTKAGPEFGPEYEGRPCKIVRALYGLRSSGKAFHDYLSIHHHLHQQGSDSVVSQGQNTVEASTYGSEMLAMRISIEMIQGLRYKLRMLGVPIDGGCNVFCDNNGVVLNMTMPESKLKKKHAAMNVCSYYTGLLKIRFLPVTSVHTNAILSIYLLEYW